MPANDRQISSDNWHLAADLKPRLRNHTRLHRQNFRGQLWYVLQDRRTGRFHRFTYAAYFVITLMDGKRTVQSVWETACVHLGDDVLTQDELIALLSQLHMADVLQTDINPDFKELGDRSTNIRRRSQIMSVMNPLAIRIPLLDPERFLNVLYPFVKPLFSMWGVLVFLATIIAAALLTGIHWNGLTNNLVDRVLVIENLLILLIAYPLVKSLHELGHGFAVKHWGGEVHEIGIMFLVFMPVPYVDASAATAFANKWRRAMVGSAGILVELLLASLAMFVWISAEEGIVRAFAFNVMLIGGVSTLLFNGNPLLRFDGYYVLSDILEIPNLSARANRHLAYLLKTHAYGVKNLDSPVTSPGEGRWLVFYAIASFLYRIFIMIAIATFVATSFFFVGVLIALWAVVLMLVFPLAKNLWFLVANPALRGYRRRALSVTFAACALVVALVGFVPVPYATISQGVLWADGEVSIKAGADGVVKQLLVAPDTMVEAGAPLFELDDPFLEARVAYLRARVAELELREADQRIANRVAARIVTEQLIHAHAELALFLERQDALLVRSGAAGKIVIPKASDMVGRYVNKGEVLAYVARSDYPIISVVVDEDDAEIVRAQFDQVSIRTAANVHLAVDAKVSRELPALTQNLPSLALSTMGGGIIPVDPESRTTPQALGNWLQFELVPDEQLMASNLGGRVYVKFDHGWEPLWPRLYRSVRQVFLKRFSF